MCGRVSFSSVLTPLTKPAAPKFVVGLLCRRRSLMCGRPVSRALPVGRGGLAVEGRGRLGGSAPSEESRRKLPVGAVGDTGTAVGTSRGCSGCWAEQQHVLCKDGDRREAQRESTDGRDEPKALESRSWTLEDVDVSGSRPAPPRILDTCTVHRCEGNCVFGVVERVGRKRGLPVYGAVACRNACCSE